MVSTGGCAHGWVQCPALLPTQPLGRLTMGRLGPHPGPSPGPRTQYGERKERVWRLGMIYLHRSPWPMEGQAMSHLWSLQPKNIKPKDKSQFQVVRVQSLCAALWCWSLCNQIIGKGNRHRLNEIFITCSPLYFIFPHSSVVFLLVWLNYMGKRHHLNYINS